MTKGEKRSYAQSAYEKPFREANCNDIDYGVFCFERARSVIPQLTTVEFIRELQQRKPHLFDTRAPAAAPAPRAGSKIDPLFDMAEEAFRKGKAMPAGLTYEQQLQVQKARSVEEVKAAGGAMKMTPKEWVSFCLKHGWSAFPQ